VIIEPYENADNQLIKVYILGSVLGMVLLQNDMVALHGGGIVIDDKGYVFTGDKGAGKSTITTALRQRGYKFVADDVCSIKQGETNKIYPGFGYQKLCDDTMVKLGYNPDDYELFDDIFFGQISKMGIYDKIKDIEVVGGQGKKLAIDKIIERDGIDIEEILYIGDSITDVEPLEFARKNNGISISFNGNEYPLNVANIAVVSENAVATSIIIDLYSRFDRDYVFDFIRTYDERGPDDAFGDFEVDYTLIEEFEKAYHNKEAPIIAIINEENREYLLLKSKAMRNSIRGKDIGGLG
jgi:hypothetical protein